MSLEQRLLKYAFAITTKQDAIYSFPVADQKRYLESLPEPKSDVERSYLQYKCQMKLYGAFLSFLLNLASYPILLAFLIKFRLVKAPERARVSAVFFRDGKPANIMPDVLRAEFPDVETDPIEGRALLGADVKALLKLAFRYPFSPQFVLKTLIKTARYRYALESYRPKAIVACNEYSFTSSAITDFCRREGVEHINVMHGEKFYFIRDSFYRFDRFYVWDRYYAALGESLRADPKQFIIALPPSIAFPAREESIEKRFDYAYYLAAEEKDRLAKIAEALRALKSRGFRVKTRPHPRYSDPQVVAELFDGIEIENWRETSIERSILESKNVIALFSTCLQQAYYNGVQFVLDDVSDVERFEKLKELRFIMLDKEPILLSDVLKESEAK